MKKLFTQLFMIAMLSPICSPEMIQQLKDSLAASQSVMATLQIKSQWYVVQGVRNLTADELAAWSALIDQMKALQASMDATQSQIDECSNSMESLNR